MNQDVLQDPITVRHTAPGSFGRLGARIEVPGTRAIVSAWQDAAYDATTGRWTAVIDAPPGPGTFNLVWLTADAEPSDYEAVLPFTASLIS